MFLHTSAIDVLNNNRVYRVPFPLSDHSGFGNFRHHCFSKNYLVKFPTSVDVRSCFERHHVPFTQYTKASHVDITKCFDESSEDGRMVVDFLTHVLKFKETAPAELQREVMEYLASSDCSQKTSDGRVLFNSDWDAVVVQKK